MAPKREGPFKVIEVLSPLSYRLELPRSWKIHPVIHITLLSPYKTNGVYGDNFPQPPPDLIEGQPEYEVESIISHRQQGRGYAFLIKWKGYSTAENTWEPERNVTNSQNLLQSYKN